MPPSESSAEPGGASALTTVAVTRKAAERVDSGHPWIFSTDVAGIGGAQAGDVVRVRDPRGRLLGVAHYSSTSKIALRLLDRRPAAVDREFFLERLRAAIAFREGRTAGTEAYRIVHAEADLLPGLIVDRYGAVVVLQALTQGMDRSTNVVVSCLRELLDPAAVVARNDAAARERESLPVEKKVLWGAIPGELAVRVDGLTFYADPLEGQKTGIFLDQRENHVAAARYARGRGLDCFTCTGGFALRMAAACAHVEGVDSSAPAIAAAERNRVANGIGNVTFRQADVFDVLTAYSTARRRFDAVVLDPPAFAKSRTAVTAALRAYREINTRALRLLESGGVLVTCSCSHHVSEAELLGVVAQASLDSSRTLRVLERRTQASDHPVLLTVPETHYLKCLILQVV